MTPPEVADDLTLQDEDQLRQHGIPLTEARRQLELLRDPPPLLQLDRPATIGDGIQQIPQARHRDLLERYRAAAASGRASKFVPASGAASRMFRSLIPYCRRPGGVAPRTDFPAVKDPAVRRLLENLERFAFFPAVAQFFDESRFFETAGLSLEAIRSGEGMEAFLETLLTPQGMNYANAPKALIPFHRYEDSQRTAFEEQLVEAAQTITDAQGWCRLHFTVVETAEGDFQAEAAAAQARMAACQSQPAIRFDISYSAQSPASDTLAVDLFGKPFRRSDGRLLLRPGGHGSLLRNLQGCGGDIVFVKNIDNVVPDSRKGPTLLWKKLLGGYLLELQERIFSALRTLEGQGEVNEEIARLLIGTLSVDPSTIPEDRIERQAFARQRLYRPLRVCGVVVNQGEPGGGPFWVQGSNDTSTSQTASLQIVEGAQIDIQNPSQAAILQSATHFNPVDLVCGLRNHRGQAFDLDHYLDPTSAFIATKSYGGRPLKALEHPGLWNGAMARWNTVFVEVPAETFAPVKTVFDLLRPEHQG